MIELPNTIVANIDQFTGRTWLLPSLLDWYEDSNQRLFLLTGGPGAGKSMVMAWLAGFGPAPVDAADADRLAQLRSAVSAGHFCQATSRNNSPLAFADSVAHQLTATVPGFADALAATLTERVQIVVRQQVGQVAGGGTVTGVVIDRINLGILGDEQSFDRAVTRPLKALYAAGYTEPMLLLVDALDEAETYSGVKLTQMLTQLDDLPEAVRFLATTRLEPRVLKHFRGVPSIDLARPLATGSDDIVDFVSQRLDAADVALTAEDRTRLAARISRASQGVFLYARLVLNEVLDEMLRQPPGRLDLADYPLPAGLSELYHAAFNRELGSDEDRWYASLQPVLGLIAVARGNGLTATQLRRIMGFDVNRPLRLCKQYLAGDLPEGPFLPFHRSLGEFLLEDEENLDYHVDAVEMHRRIVESYLLTYKDDWSRCDMYGLSNIIDHAVSAGLPTAENPRTYERILTDGFVTAVQSRMGWLYSLVEDLSVLAAVEPTLTAHLCYGLILDRPPISLVIQQALRLLVKLGPQAPLVDGAGKPARASVQRVVEILGGPSNDAPRELLSMLAQEQKPRVRGVIALALAETGASDVVAPTLVEMLHTDRGEGSWAAADALVALNDRTVITELVEWYQAIQTTNDQRNSADKQRILYILGWMHAEEAEGLKQNARTSPHYRVVGRGVDLCWLLPPVSADQIYLHDQLLRILESPPQEPKTLGPWADEWLQKRLVRAIERLRLIDLLSQLRQLRTHIQARPAPQAPGKKTPPWAKATPKRERLLGSVEEAIAQLERSGAA